MSKLEISPELLDALQKLTSLLESDDSLEETLQTVVDLSAANLPGCDGAGVTMRVNGEETTAVATDEYTIAIDNIQYDTNEGPCVTAVKEGTFQRIDAISEEERWPEFTRRAGEKGFRSGMSFPLTINGTSAALNLYAKKERAFDEATTAMGEVFANQAVIALQNARTYMAARQVADQLNEALKTRDMIGQAKGILMEREGISDEEAFDMLKTISQNSNVKLRDIALKLVSERSRVAD